MAYLEGGGAAWAVGNSELGIKKYEFSERFECRTCAIPYEDPQPRLFSFNNPFGACPTCHGFGNIVELDMNLVVPDPKKSIQQGAIEPWTKPHYRAQLAELKRAAKKHKVFLDAPWEHLSDEEKRFVVEGAEDPKEFAGIRGFFKWLERKKYKVHVRVFLSRYRGYLTCPDCGGARLRREARDVQVSGRTIDRVSSLTVREAQGFFSTLQLTEKEQTIADKVLKEIQRRLSFLSDVGLDYLTLGQPLSTLSGGECQRIKLASELHKKGSIYVLDEPTTGLHMSDISHLLEIMNRLVNTGNTVIVIEHNTSVIKNADWIIDMGPEGGNKGGKVMFEGTPKQLLGAKQSLTSAYLQN
jgi:excinuclease ABC subunit A